MSRARLSTPLVVALTLFLALVPLQAATFRVTKTADTADGTCDADCSLREAVIAANAAGGTNTIELPAGTYVLAIAGSGEDAALKGDLDLTGTLTIAGAGAATTIIDGNRIDRVFQVRAGAVVNISAVEIRNGRAPAGNGGGILNDGTLSLADVLLDHNDAVRDPATVPGTHTGDGGAIFNSGTLTLSGTGIYNNNAARAEVSPSGAIFNTSSGTLTLNRSSLAGNGNINTCAGSAVYNEGKFVANNVTISGNLATSIFCAGPAMLNLGPATMALNNATVTDNIPIGVFRGGDGTITIQNTLIARNGLNRRDEGDCENSLGLHSLGYNLIGAASCSVESTTGDQIGTPSNPIDPKLGQLIGFPKYQPLLAGSKAIDAGNPAGCAGSGGALDTDQRSAARVGPCDVGAYEFTSPAAAAVVFANDGMRQHAGPLTAFRAPLQAAVLDRAGAPVSGVAVTFTAPASGPTATFVSAASAITAVTNDSGVASAAPTANAVLGNYEVAATVSGISAPAVFPLTNLVWYVAAGGDGAANCFSPATACPGVNAVLAKESFVPGDTVLVAAGTYTGTATDAVVVLDQSVRLSGGWTNAFASQSGTSVIDGQNARGGVVVVGTAVIQRFTIRNGSRVRGGGIHVTSGTALTVEDSTIAGNTESGDSGGGIENEGTLTLVRTTVSDNKSAHGSGGIHNYKTLTLRNSTISGNDGGVVNNGGTISLNNSTITANRLVGIGNPFFGSVTVSNSIIAGNAAPDCSGAMTSSDYNVIGNNDGCFFTAMAHDLLGTNASPVDPLLWPLQNNAGPTRTHALKTGSPAIGAGNPAAPGSGAGACEATDQRGVPRTRCDAGAFQSLTRLRSARPPQ